jgi:hypothetical protein
MGRPFGKIAWTPETLATRVCKNSHVGEWKVRSNGTIVCAECQADAQKRYRSGARDHETRTYTRSDSLAVLEATEKKLEIVRKMKELREQLDTLD